MRCHRTSAAMYEIEHSSITIAAPSRFEMSPVDLCGLYVSCMVCKHPFGCCFAYTHPRMGGAEHVMLPANACTSLLLRMGTHVQ